MATIKRSTPVPSGSSGPVVPLAPFCRHKVGPCVKCKTGGDA